MRFLQTELVCALGVTVSFLLPALLRSVRKEWSMADSGGAVVTLPDLITAFFRGLQAVYPIIRRYLLLAVFSIIVGLVIVVFLQDQLTTLKSAFLAGYVWDSTFQKFTGQPQGQNSPA